MSRHRVRRDLPVGRRGLAALATALVLAGGGTYAALAVPEDATSKPAGVRTTVPDRADPTAALPQTSPAAPVMAASEPLLLSIPAIGVSSPVRPLGQNTDGTMEVPAVGPFYDDAGWYRYSPTPGERGPSVLAGHVDSAADGPSVFFELGALEPGDGVEVTRVDGSVATFAVDEVRSYPKSGFPTDLVYGDTAGSTLRLITCGGTFDESSGHYVDNVVVYASLVVPPD